MLCDRWKVVLESQSPPSPGGEAVALTPACTLTATAAQSLRSNSHSCKGLQARERDCAATLSPILFKFR